MKRCGDCRRKKPISDFHVARSRHDGRQPWCKKCHNARARRWRRKNPGYHTKRLARDPHYFRRSKLRSLYGISLETYEEMLASQKAVCAICGEQEKRKLQGRPAPLVVDHDHMTKKVRGLLCHACNTALAHIERIAWAEKARSYLARYEA